MPSPPAGVCCGRPLEPRANVWPQPREQGRVEELSCVGFESLAEGGWPSSGGCWDHSRVLSRMGKITC